MIDADRPFRNQDPLDENVRSGAERSGVGTWDLDFSSRKLDWSNTTRTLFGVAPDTPVDYELFLSLLEPRDRDRTEAALKRSIAHEEEPSTARSARISPITGANL